MKKQFLSVIGLAVFIAMFCFGSVQVYAFDEVSIKVVTELGGKSVDWESFEADFYNPPGEGFDILTHGDGVFELGENFIGDKISLSGNGLKSEWTEIKAEGTVIVCHEKEPQ